MRNNESKISFSIITPVIIYIVTLTPNVKMNTTHITTNKIIYTLISLLMKLLINDKRKRDNKNYLSLN